MTIFFNLPRDRLKKKTPNNENKEVIKEAMII